MSLFSNCLRANCRSAMFDFYVDAFKARLMLSSRSRAVENLKRLTQFQLRPLHNFYLDVPIYIYISDPCNFPGRKHMPRKHNLSHSFRNDHYNIFARKSGSRCLKGNCRQNFLFFFLSQYIPLRLQNPKCANKRHIV